MGERSRQRRGRVDDEAATSSSGNGEGAAQSRQRRCVGPQPSSTSTTLNLGAPCSTSLSISASCSASLADRAKVAPVMLSGKPLSAPPPWSSPSYPPSSCASKERPLRGRLPFSALRAIRTALVGRACLSDLVAAAMLQETMQPSLVLRRTLVAACAAAAVAVAAAAAAVPRSLSLRTFSANSPFVHQPLGRPTLRAFPPEEPLAAMTLTERRAFFDTCHQLRILRREAIAIEEIKVVILVGASP
ncbi:unnamed protein product [Closterium sp. NIES-54]